MKILLCTNSFENVTNGPAKFANLVLEIQSFYPEHEVRVLTEDSTQSKPGVYPLAVNIPGFLKLFGQFIRMFLYHRAAQRIRKEFAYDVLVYNNSFIGLWSALVSRQATVGMINDDNNLQTSWHTFKPTSRWLKQFLFRICEKKSVRKHQCIITNSDFMTAHVIRAYGHAPKIRKMYKAIDLSMASFLESRAFAEPIRVLFVKADYRRGDLQTLIQALTLLKEHRFVVTVVGPEERFKTHIESFFQKKDSVSLHWQGEQPQSVVRQLMATHDLFCVPALQEALGVANIEALAAGLPVVSTRVGGIPEVLDQGNNGWLAEPGNALQLAEAIQACIMQTAVRTKKVLQGKEFVQKFAKEEMFREFLSILAYAISR